MHITSANAPSKVGPVRKVYDIFTFFNELDLLEIRLNILDPFVDFFVIIEATETFSGRPRPLAFDANRQRYEKFAKKIIHYVVNDTPADWDDLQRRLNNPQLDPLDREIIQHTLTSDNIKPGVVHWLKEFYQKESIKKALVSLADNDICFVSDVDEIWNPRAVPDFTNGTVYKFRQLVYSYFLNNRSDEPWAGTLATTYKTIRQNCLNHLRTAGKTKYTHVDHGGWHFTNQGGAEYLRTKIEASYSSADLNTPDIKRRLAARLEKNLDYVGRSFRFWVDETDLPSYIIEHRQQYQSLMKTLPLLDEQELAVIIKLQGGLGNQLFQFALGRSLAIVKHVLVRYDLSWFTQQTERRLEIEGYDLHLTPATDDDLRAVGVGPSSAGIDTLIRRLFGQRSKVYVEHGLPFHADVFDLVPPAYLNGYWQSEKYFSNIATTIRKEFQLRQSPQGKNSSMLSDMKSQEAVAIHIRRGDYVHHPQISQAHGMTSLEYYQSATRYMLKRFPQAVFYVFSDDLVWVKDNLSIKAKIIFVDQNGPDKGWEDLRLMSNCKHHIIANSTFGWWGAWLAEHPGQIVIAPKKWFASPAMDARDVVPERWLRM